MAGCVLIFLSCKTDTVGTNGSNSISRRTTIDSTSGYGFSFDRGSPQRIPAYPIPDTVDDFDAGFVITSESGPEPLGLCFSGYTDQMFHLVHGFSTFDSARTFFVALSEITDTSFIQNTCGGFGVAHTDPVIRVNQVWSIQTRQNKFAKMLIVTDTIVANHPQVTFDWVYQPSGSRQF